MDWISNRPYRLAMLAQMLYVGCDLTTWLFAGDGTLYFSTSSYSKELCTFWETGGCKEYAMTTGSTLDKPFVMSDALGFVWVGEYTEVTSGSGRALVLLGPMFNSETTIKSFTEKMREHNMALSLQSIGRQLLVHIPILPIPTMNQYIRMLHYAITLKPIDPRDYIYQSNGENPPGQNQASDSHGEMHLIDYENAHLLEQLIMQCVREGNIHYKGLLEKYQLRRFPESYMTGNPLREAKDILIIFASHCCQAAIEGKLPISTAKQMEKQAIRRIEACMRLTDLIQLRRQIMDEYIKRVHAVQSTSGISQPVLTCCDYVKAHFMEPLELADIAKAVCYNEYYLSRKFQKEMGLQLRDYIRNVRLEYAKIWLASTEMSIREISELLQFGTRNYFTRVFRAQEGITPSEYRKRAGVIIFSPP